MPPGDSQAAPAATSARQIPIGAAPGGRDREGRIDLVGYLLILGQLGLVLLLLRQFEIESAAFRNVALLTVAGFAVHALLPIRHRLAFFVLLSIAAICSVLDIREALWLFALGGALISICHLPVSVAIRTVLLLASAALLIAMRAAWITVPWSSALWPILGSMFMFRLIIYFYDLRHNNAPTSLTGTLAYFFMLPNVCFPLFPVIDYKTFRRNYFDQDTYRIYQTGVDWMLRGVVHLVLYRLIYYYFTLAPSEVADPDDLFQYLVANFLLYLRISGLFHLIVGMLYLFGFRLPETHHRYLLAASFTDFWRRINIYWKDFMLKIFYYPTVFKLKRLGTMRAMVLATLLVFFLTWFLHAYQWFWLRGSYLLVWQDVLFWAILGLLVVANSLYEARHGRPRSLGKAARSWRSLSLLTLKTFATFWLICVLWSFWTSESIEQWLSLWSALGGELTWKAPLYPLGSLAIIVASTLLLPEGKAKAAPAPAQRLAMLKGFAVTAGVLLVLNAVSIEHFNRHLGTQVANTVHSLRSGRLSRLDTAKLERGYYENLLSVDRFNSQLWEVYMKKPAQLMGVESANIKRFTADFAGVELTPSVVASTNYGTITINRWGMRDQDYELKPMENTHRTVMLGTSTLMGWGVADGETFEALLERRLNREYADKLDRRFEILNAGVPGYKPPQQLVALERALRFEPDCVLYVAAGRELSRAVEYLAEVSRDGIEIPYPGLAELVASAGVQPGMERSVAMRRLRPLDGEILSWIYRSLVAQARAAGAVPLFALVPQVREGQWEEETAETLQRAAAAGFMTLNLEDVFDDYEIERLRVADWDDHPNALGHQLIADRLYEEFERRDLILRTLPQRPGDSRNADQKQDGP